MRQPMARKGTVAYDNAKKFDSTWIGNIGGQEFKTMEIKFTRKK